MSKPRVIVVPTIDEVVSRGRSPQFALAFVAGEKAKFELLIKKPDVTDAELSLAGEDALESKLLEIFHKDVAGGVEDVVKFVGKAIDEKLDERLLKSEPIELKASVEETEPSALKLIDLMRRGMHLTLAMSGHVADVGVTQWLREVDELGAALKPALLPPIEEA